VHWEIARGIQCARCDRGTTPPLFVIVPEVKPKSRLARDRDRVARRLYLCDDGVECVCRDAAPDTHHNPQGTLTISPTRTDAAQHDALRLVSAAKTVATRLERFCAGWPEEQFGGLVYDVALARLSDQLPPEDTARLRGQYAAHHDEYLARLRERAD
jgi:hypothetical protein